MVELSLSFAFGSILGCSSMTFSEFAEMYANKCAAAADWLTEGPTDREGLGWLSLPDADMKLIKEAGRRLRGYDNIIHVGIGGSALGNLMLNQALFGDFFNGIVTTDHFFHYLSLTGIQHVALRKVVEPLCRFLGLAVLFRREIFYLFVIFVCGVTAHLLVCGKKRLPLPAQLLCCSRLSSVCRRFQAVLLLVLQRCN